MKNRKGGFTLIEIIIAMALIGIIAAGLIPAFAAQFKMTINARNFTTTSFDAQGEMENVIFDLKNALTDPRLDESLIEGFETTEKTIFGKRVTVYSLRKSFPGNDIKSFVVFLSKRLADMELRQLLVATGVRIKVNGGSYNNLADLKITPKPWLEGEYDKNPDSNWYANVYEWYKSKEGNPNPKFPDDYEKIIFAGKTPDTLMNISDYANRYIVFTVTPVDIHGVRGNEVMSSNIVYVLGEEWLSGVFAWVDKDGNGSYSDKTDVSIVKPNYGTWPLVKGFDGGKKFIDPTKPDNELNPKDGSLYVPMGIDRSSGEDNGTINISGENKIDWIMDKSINLAIDIKVDNSEDVRLATRDGNIILYRYVKLDRNGKVTYDAKGLPTYIDKGPEVDAKNGSITFEMEGRGDIILQEYSKLKAGKDITLIPYGHINLFKSILEAEKSITLDSTKGSSYPGNRDISISDSTIQVNEAGKNISISTKDRLNISDSTLGNIIQRNNVILSAPSGINLSEVSFKNSKVDPAHNMLMNGGGWDTNSVFIVPDGKTITFGNGKYKVQNDGSLVLGDTGGVRFANGNSDNLKNPLRLSLSRAGNNQVTIDTNYGRNVGYADDSGAVSASFNSYQSLGSGQTNLKYMITKSSGSGSPSISCSFDGTDRITIKASGISETRYTNTYELSVQDRYATGVTDTIRFTVGANANSSPTVQVAESSTTSSYTVIFNSNGGSSVTPSSKTVVLGEMVGSLPDPPTKTGFYFGGWTTEKDGGDVFNENYIVTGNMTVYAKWRTVPVYKVTFYYDTGTVPLKIFDVRNIEWGDALGTLQRGPSWSNEHIFLEWNTKSNGQGNKATEHMVIKADTDLYGIYDYVGTEEKWTVTFNKNGGDADADPTLMLAFKEEPLGQLPEPPTRSGYNFVGWNTQSNGNGSTFTERTVVTKNLTVYAKWTPKPTYAITFNRNYTGGSGSSVVTTINAVEGEPIGTLPEGPFRSGYYFNGWFTTSSQSGGQQITENDIFSRTTTVYARWTRKTEFTVTFNNNGGSGVNPSSIKVYDGEGVGTLPTQPTRSGYAFVGWNTKNDGSGNVFDANTPVTGNMTVYAQWRVAYTVDFYRNNNSGDTYSLRTITVGQGEAIGNLTTPTRSGYIFKGWYTHRSGGTQITNNTVVTGNTIFYAQWAESCTVSFNRNNSNSDNTVLYTMVVEKGSQLGSLPADPTRSRYTFQGWYTTRSGNGGSQVTAQTVINNGMTVYARWRSR